MIRLFPAVLVQCSRRSCGLALVLALWAAPLAAQDFRAVSRAELEMKDNPASPGDHAMILEWVDSQNDTDSYEDEYYRIKIFSEEGRKYADIEVPYLKGITGIIFIKARTIRPDGTVVPFEGKVFDKPIYKYRRFKYQAKTFTLPDVQPGSILEYRFRRSWDRNALYYTRWVLQKELFVRRAQFSFAPYLRVDSRFMAVGLAPGQQPVRRGDRWEMTLENIPAFREEAFAPPEEQLKPRIEFFYSREGFTAPDRFWPDFGKKVFADVEDFVGKSKALEAAAQEIVGALDTPEKRLRALYARVQSLRNLSFERSKSEQESKAEKLKENKKAEDVWKNGYGSAYALNELLVALARGAGFEAHTVLVSQRDEVIFNPNLPDGRQMNGVVARVRAGGQEYFLDVGTPFCPFGLLRWPKTGVDALLMDHGGGSFIKTPQPTAEDTLTVRSARLRLEDGILKGTMEWSFGGFEALERRLRARADDEQETREELEEELKGVLLAAARVKVTGIEGLRGVEEPLVVRFDVEFPDPSSAAGSRILLPVSVFHLRDVNPLRESERTHPLYFSYPYTEQDKVSIELPEGIMAERMPPPRTESSPFGKFQAFYAVQGLTLTLDRRFSVIAVVAPREYYSLARTYFERVANGDSDAAVLRTSAAGGR
jgi:hypothetical protein